MTSDFRTHPKMELPNEDFGRVSSLFIARWKASQASHKPVLGSLSDLKYRFDMAALM